MPEMSRCRDCCWWNPFGEDRDSSTHGACERLEAMGGRQITDTPANEVNLLALFNFDGRAVETVDDEPFGIVIGTGRDFGCTLWEARTNG